MTDSINSAPGWIVFWALFVFAVLVGVTGPARSGGNDNITVLITNAPAKNSAAYRALVSIAGSPPSRTLELTKCEVWSVPKGKVGELTRAAAAGGSTVTRLTSDWNTSLRPMAPGPGMSESETGLMEGAMESTAATGAIVLESPKSNVFEYALTKDMYSETDGRGPSQIMIPLRKDLTVTVSRIAIVGSKGRLVWWGTIAGNPGITTLMWWPSGRITGTVRYDGRVFVIKHIGGRRHCVVEMVADLLPREHAPMGAGTETPGSEGSDPLIKHGDMSMAPRMAALADVLPETADAEGGEKIDPDNVTITLLVAYTREAASHYTSIENDLIALAVEDANRSFVNSGVNNVKLRLVHTFETSYQESGSHFDHLYDLLLKDDGKLDDVHELRDEHRADVALLIVHDPIGCGLAAKVGADESRGFAVVHHECAATSYSLAHEIGHIIGARHDTAIDDSSDPFPYGHGFINGQKWRTMMSYRQGCNDCPRVPSWSNPETLIEGVRAGDAKSNNARVIREQAARVAAFR